MLIIGCIPSTKMVVPTPTHFYWPLAIGERILTCGPIPAPSNWSSYSNKKVDQLFDEAGSTYDVQLRARAYRQIQQLMFDDALLTSGYFLPWNFVYQKYVKGLITAFSAVDLKEVWLDK
jgi:ABC-type transport system substrate-binding protein